MQIVSATRRGVLRMHRAYAKQQGLMGVTNCFAVGTSAPTISHLEVRPRPELSCTPLGRGFPYELTLEYGEDIASRVFEPRD